MTASLLGFCAIGDAAPEPQAATRPSGNGGLARGSALLSAGRYLEAADAFKEDLAGAASKFTVQVAVYCDVAYLERHLRTSGVPLDLFLLHRTVRDQDCFGLYWGLFDSRTSAAAASRAAPPAAQTPDRLTAAVAAVLASTPASAPRTARAAPSAPPPTPATSARGAGARALEPIQPADTPPPPTGLSGTASPPLPVERSSPPPPSTRVSESPTTPADAQTVTSPRVELAFGYAYLWDDSLKNSEINQSFKLGALVSVTVNVSRRLGLVGEVSLHDGSLAVFALPAAISPFGNGRRTENPLTGVNPTVQAYHAGVRYTDRDDRIVTPYVQLLVGATRYSVSVSDQGTSVTASLTHTSFQPGLGIAGRISDTVAIDAGIDYRWVIQPDEPDANQFRFHAGLVVRLGRRVSQVPPKSPEPEATGNRKP